VESALRAGGDLRQEHGKRTRLNDYRRGRGLRLRRGPGRGSVIERDRRKRDRRRSDGLGRRRGPGLHRRLGLGRASGRRRARVDRRGRTRGRSCRRRAGLARTAWNARAPAVDLPLEVGTQRGRDAGKLLTRLEVRHLLSLSQEHVPLQYKERGGSFSARNERGTASSCRRRNCRRRRDPASTSSAWRTCALRGRSHALDPGRR